LLKVVISTRFVLSRGTDGHQVSSSSQEGTCFSISVQGIGLNVLIALFSLAGVVGTNTTVNPASWNAVAVAVGCGTSGSSSPLWISLSEFLISE
jgi:hypothetical protein